MKFGSQFVLEQAVDNASGAVGGGGSAASGGAAADDTGGGDAGGKGGTVTRDAYERMQADLVRHKEEARKLREEREADATRKLKEANQFKELAERYETENKTLKEENHRIKSSVLEERRYSTVREAAKKLGLRAEAVSDLEGLDLSEVSIETTSTGKINVLGADKFAERLKTVKPHWFSAGNAGSVNSSTPRAGDSDAASGGAVTTQDLIAAEREGRKSGDMSKYHDLHKRFRAQGVRKSG